MHSAIKFLLSFFLLIVLLFVSFIQLFVFMYVLGAEGPILVFFIWFLLAVMLTFLYYSVSVRLKILKTAAGIAALLSVVLGILAVLVQIQVTQRSLAEAWLEVARSGEAFGFFSFFAAEVYALFIFVQAVFFSKKKYLSFVFSIPAAACICCGIVFNSALLLSGTIVFALLMYIFYSPGTAARIRGRIVSSIFPLASTLVIGIIISLLVWSGPDPSFPSVPVNLAPMVQRFAPQFPLLTNIPGYGFSPETQKMPRSTFLTTRSLFEVSGQPLSIHYLLTERFLNWRGTSWSKDNEDKNTPIPVSAIGEGSRLTGYSISESVLLTLLEDFYKTFPVKTDTVEIRIQNNTGISYTADEADALLFEQSVKRGTQVLLLQSKDKFNYTEEEIPALDASAQRTYTSTYEGSSEWKSLVKKIREQSYTRSQAEGIEVKNTSPEWKRMYLKVLLEYFTDGFTYSLSTGAPVTEQNPLEYFLFESKKGFCIYYASAFVLLAREAGIPARMVEGFRVQLDETGKGRITGSSAHAWSEVWIDGQWRIFEPTPPFMSDNPFSYVNENDRSARIQLEQLFANTASGAGTDGKLKYDLFGLIKNNYLLLLFILLSLAGITAAVFILIPVFSSAERKIQINAGKMVRKYTKKGIERPEITGWVEWKKQVFLINKEDAETADAMIYLVYSGGKASDL